MRTRLNLTMLSKFSSVVILALAISTNVLAQCGCTFTIPAGGGGVTFDGAAQGVKPGDVICLSAGSRERVLFINIRGSADRPVTIKNCGGQVLLGGPNANSGLVFWSSRYFRITGSGDPGVEYGIKITETRPSTSGIVVTSLSSDVEIDHVEITKTGFAGVMAKTDPTSDCANTGMLRPNFTMYNIKLHHNYVHHIGGEGFYVGNSFYAGTTVYCGSTQYPHEIRGVRIYDNVFDACGWESIQVGSAVQDVEVYNNRVYNYGTADINSQNGGIQFGLGTSGRLYNNFIKGNPNGTGGQAIVIQGIGNTYVYNNIIVNSPDESITVNTKPTPLSTDIVNRGWLGGTYVINNTIVNPGKAAIADFVNQAPGNVFYNNLVVVGNDPNWNRTKPYYDWTISNNVVINSLSAAGFVNAAIDDYSLRSESPAINAGRDVASFGVVSDYQGRGRPSGASWDAGAFELAGNQRPVVSAGVNQSITLPTNIVSITGTASDPDGSISSYTWTKKSGPNATLQNANTPTLSLSNLVEGSYILVLTVTDNGGESASAEMTLTVLPATVNHSPTANAGPDQTLTLPANTIVLNGTGSDDDGTITTYNWSKVSGPDATTGPTNTPALSLTNLVAGMYIFRITVTDDDGDAASDDVSVVVNPPAVNVPPTANAGEDKNLALPTTEVSLEGTGSDPDGNIQTFSWTKQSGGPVVLTNANSSVVQLTGMSEGTYIFRLTVTDNQGATAHDDVTITVTTVNQPPIVNGGGNKTIRLPTNSVVLNGSASDADGSVTTYLWSKVNGPSASMANANTPALTLTGLVQGTYIFRLTVTDDDNATATANVTVIVQAANIPPTANPGGAMNVTLPVNTIIINGSGSDSDGSIVSFMWEKVSGPSATLTNSNTRNLTVSNLVEGTYTFRLTVTDNENAKGSATVRVVVFPAAINRAPTVNAGPNVTITLPANSITLNGTSSDSDGTIAALLWEKVSGPPVSMGNTTQLSLNVSNLVEGSYVFRLTATDDKGASASDLVTVTVTSINQVPNVNAGPDLLITLPTNSVTLDATAADPDGSIASILWTKQSGPAATPGIADQLTFTVTNLESGIYVFRVTVTDNDGASAVDHVRVTVQTPTNINPTVNAGPNVILTLPTNSVNLTGSATDVDGTISSYAWTQISGSPATLSNSSVQTVTVSDLTAGIFILRLTVTDDAGGVAFDDVRVTVRAAAVNTPPVADAGPDISLTLPNNSTNLIGSGTDVNGSIASYQWTKVSGPPATFTNANTAVLSARDLQEGLYILQLEVVDNAGAKHTDVAIITVMPAAVNQTPTVSVERSVTVVLPTNIVTLHATAGDPDGSIGSYLWTQRSGLLATVSGESTAALTLSDLSEGIYIFRISVNDNQGAEAFAEVTVNVIMADANQPPVVSLGENLVVFLPTDQVTISGNASDPDGSIVNYEWSKSSGPPANLINASTPTLSVTDLMAGNYVLRLTVTDNDGLVSYKEISVTVFPGIVNQVPIAHAGANQTIVYPNNTTAINGSGYDPDGSIVSYSWTQLSGPIATLENPTSPTLLVNNLSIGTFIFELTIEDDGGATGKSNVQITVVEVGFNQSPIADAGFDKLVSFPVNSVEIQGSATDPDGTINSYSWTKKSGPAAGVMSGSSTSKLSLTDLGIGTYVFVLTVVDNRGGSNTDEVKVTVAPGTFNQNPVVTVTPYVYLRLPEGHTTITATASDPDGAVISFLWTQQEGPPTVVAPNDGASLSLTNLEATTYVFKVVVTDDKGAISSADVAVTVAPVGPNSPPVIGAISDQTIVLPVTTASISASVSDIDGFIESLAWSQQSGPTDATLGGTSGTTLTASNLSVGSYVFTLSATDNEHASTVSETTVVVIDLPNATTRISAGRDTTLVLPNNTISLSGQLLESATPIVSYVWSQVDGPEAHIVGEYPIVSAVDLTPGKYTFRFTVTDISGNSTSDDVSVMVIENASNPLGASLFFSPNDDFYNDSWFIQNLDMIDKCPINIFNSLGKKVFSAESYENNWTGLLDGQLLRAGDYYYVIECEHKRYAGAVRLIR